VVIKTKAKEVPIVVGRLLYSLLDKQADGKQPYHTCIQATTSFFVAVTTVSALSTRTTNDNSSSDAHQSSKMCLNETTMKQKHYHSKSSNDADGLASLSPSSGGTVDSSSDDLSSSSNSSLDGSASATEDETPGTTPKLQINDISSNSTCNRRHQLLRRQSSIQEASLHLTAGTIVSIAVVFFSLFFPFMFTPTAARDTYKFAFWKYDPQHSHFDNTAWTYGTDYFLALCMLALSSSIQVRHPAFRTAGWRSRGLLACYMFSVMAGGLAHQCYETVEQRNTWHFRVLWTICVGFVAAASGFMGAAGTELLRLEYLQYDNLQTTTTTTIRMPVIPDWFWIGYAVFVTATVAYGGFSCHRPACDIFIAGITQFPSTFYVIGVLFCQLKRYKRITNTMRILGCFGFILNAPLLPLYPILVQYTDWSLASVNTLLHSWLLITWSLQGLCLRHVGNAVIAANPVPNNDKTNKTD